MTIPPDTIEGATCYAEFDEAVYSRTSIGDAVEEWITEKGWYLGDSPETIVIVGAAKDESVDPDDERIPDGCEYFVKEVGRVTVDLSEWCQEFWPERMEKP